LFFAQPQQNPKMADRSRHDRSFHQRQRRKSISQIPTEEEEDEEAVNDAFWYVTPSDARASSSTSARRFQSAQRKAAADNAHSNQAQDEKITPATVFEDISKESLIFSSEVEEKLPRFSFKDVNLGSFLGEGSFCSVHEIKGFKSATGSSFQLQKGDNNELNNSSHHIIHGREFMLTNYKRGGETRYAMKKMQGFGLSEEEEEDAIIDLAIEARFLAVLAHPQIINLRGVGFEKEESWAQKGFFLVLDKLEGTLKTKLMDWKEHDVKLKKSLLATFMGSKKKKKNQFICERLGVAIDLSYGLSFLHSSNVIYRDMKPDNVGFDIKGDLKIFDFGLCREIKPKEIGKDGTYNLTGCVGAPRYMSPEVAFGKWYNTKADVFSFSILLWEMVTLSGAFPGFSSEECFENVSKKGLRPDIPAQLPQSLHVLLNDCWSKTIIERWDFDTIAQGLIEVIKAFGGLGKCQPVEDKNGCVRMRWC